MAATTRLRCGHGLPMEVGGTCLACENETLRLRLTDRESRLQDLAQRLGVSDGGRYLNDWYSRIDHLRSLEGQPGSTAVRTDDTKLQAAARRAHYRQVGEAQ